MGKKCSGEQQHKTLFLKGLEGNFCKCLDSCVSATTIKVLRFTGMPLRCYERLPLIIYRLSPPTLPLFPQCLWEHGGRASNKAWGPQKPNLFYWLCAQPYPSGDFRGLSPNPSGGRFQYWHMIPSLEKVLTIGSINKAIISLYNQL